MKKKTLKHEYLQIVDSYNSLFNKIFEDAIFADKDSKIIKTIFQKIQEISGLLESLSDDEK